MNQTLRGRQCWALVLLLLTGWSLTLPAGSRDSWIAIALAAALSLPLFALYCLPAEMLGGSLPDVLNRVYGRLGGTAVLWALCVLAFWGLCMSSMSFVVFLRTVAEEQWPVWLIAGFFLLTVLAAAHGGAQKMGLWAEPVVWIVLAALILSLVLTLKDADWRQALPMLANGWEGIQNETIYALAAPFAECWFAAALLFGQSRNLRAGCLAAAVTGGVLLAWTALRNITVLGEMGTQAVWYPTYSAAGLIEIGKSFQRGEVLVSGSLLLCSVARAAVFLCFFGDGISDSLPSVSRRSAIMTAAAACFAVCVLSVGGTMDFLRAEVFYRMVLFSVLLLVAVFTAVGAVWRSKQEE